MRHRQSSAQISLRLRRPGGGLRSWLPPPRGRPRRRPPPGGASAGPSRGVCLPSMARTARTEGAAEGGPRAASSHNRGTGVGHAFLATESLAVGYGRAKGVGRTSPNPAGGAVLVRGGKVVGCGVHRAAGLPHAEVEAIRDAGSLATGADLYVTLEPCCHVGRTGACTEAILSAGIRRVAAALKHPNPPAAARGRAGLR